MARTITRKTETQPEAVAEQEELPAGSTAFDPATLDRQPPAPQTAERADDRASERQQDAQARDAERAVTHAERHERPRPRSTEVITDTGAKMRMHSNHENYRVAFTFDDGKPSEAIRELLKDAGFRWNSDATAWEKPTHYETRVRDRIDAQRAFDAVADMRREEMGVSRQR